MGMVVKKNINFDQDIKNLIVRLHKGGNIVLSSPLLIPSSLLHFISSLLCSLFIHYSHSSLLWVLFPFSPFLVCIKLISI